MLVPKLRFKEFTDEWKKLNLEKNFIYFPTNSFSRSELTTTGSIKNVHYGDIHKKYKSIVSCSNHINSFVKENIITKGTQIAENDLIFADASEDYDGIGKAIEIININNEIVYSGLHTIHARDINKNFSPSFQGYYFNTKLIQHQFRVMANGFKVFGISKKNINSLNVNIPSLKEQEKIAKLFTLLDKLIELQQRKIEALKLYNKGISKILFSDKYSYKCIRLKKIINVLPKSKLMSNEGLQSGNYPFFTNGSQHKFLNEYSIDNEIILVNTGGVANFQYYNGKCSYMSDCLAINCSDNTLYVYYYLQYIKNKINQIAFTGSGIKHLDKSYFYDVCIPIKLDDNINQEISSVFTHIIARINCCNDLKSKLEKIKKGLLQQMFI